MRIGFHVQTAGGWRKALERGLERRCTTLQVFTSAPVQWARKKLDPEETAWFAERVAALDLQPLFVHAAYLLNLATADRALRKKSRDNLAEELCRADQIGACGVVLHLGSVGPDGDPEDGLRRVARGVDEALEAADRGVSVLLENCAGQGSLVGCTPAALGTVVDLSRRPERLQVCLDTAHAFARGYALHTPEGLDQLLRECDAAFGLERLALIHANDSKSELGSCVDRHWHIGHGKIGREGFAVIMNEPRLQSLPFIMETPSSSEWDLRNLRALRRAVRPEVRPPLPRLRRSRDA
jgi:deoxyribonuclease-4